MRRRRLRGLIGDLRALRRALWEGQLKEPSLIQRRLGRLQGRHPQLWKWARVKLEGRSLSWTWDREKARRAILAEGAYLLRACWSERDPATLWATHIQLTEAEAAFRALKSEVKIRPIWHRLAARVEADVLVAFLGYCLWVCLKKKVAALAPGLTLWQVLSCGDRVGGGWAAVPAADHAARAGASGVAGVSELAVASATGAAHLREGGGSDELARASFRVADLWGLSLEFPRKNAPAAPKVGNLSSCH